MPDWLRMLAQGLFWVVSMTLIMRWLARGRHRAAPAAAGGRVQHHARFLVIGVICTLFFVGVMVAASIWPDEGVNFWFYAFMTGFVLLGAYLVADYRFARHTVSGAGMDFGRPTGRRLAFGWADVRTVRFSKSWNWFRIELESGNVVHVSGMMTGLPEFAGKVLEQVPAARIDRDTLQMLRDTAKGQLPLIW
ncbi:hypothetical protein [Massilia sp. BSC265]|uniref:hypothetical protein n=1 Tax=Massilia sp. BSC265 TaxID=1549812 RepID=UPI0004E874ED|nr:hypothetical protein [Massilia sp. BSC265]KFI08357.1 hypothetical protein JN27_04105 [Massilia sp. BSC265]